MKPLERFMPAALIIGIGLSALFCIQHYVLLGPHVTYNDSDYHYVLGAACVVGDGCLPRFGHPGLTLMFVLGWVSRLLQACGLLSAWSLSDFLREANPFRSVLDLFLIGRLVSMMIVTAYLVLLYRVVLQMSRHRLLALGIVLYNILVVGLFEQMFIVRPEALSALFVLCVFWLYNRYRTTDRLWKALLVMTISGSCVCYGLLTKIQLLVFLPLYAFFIADFVRRNYAVDRKRYVWSMGFLLVANVCLGWYWFGALRLEFLHAVLADIGSPTALTGKIAMLHAKIQGALPFGGVIILASLLGGLVGASTSRWTQRFRATVLALLAVLTGVWLSLYSFALNAAVAPLAWARRVLVTAIGETVYYTFLRQLFIERRPSLTWLFFFPSELQHVLFSSMAFVLTVGMGIIYAQPRRRITLGFLCGYLFFLTWAFNMRGGSHWIDYYQVYYLILISLLVVLAVQAIRSRQLSSRAITAISAVVGLLLCVDTWQALRYRMTLFHIHEYRSNDLTTGLAYWGPEAFLRDVLEPHSCNEHHHEKCHQQIDERFALEKARYRLGGSP